MTNLEKFIKKNTSSISGETFNWSNEAISNQILDLAKALNKDLKLINKPVETTNEQPKNGIWYEGRFLPLMYEEIADLLCHYRDSGHAETLKRKKCENAIGTLIPITDY